MRYATLALTLLLLTSCDPISPANPVTLALSGPESVEAWLDGERERCDFELVVTASDGEGTARMDSVAVTHFYPGSGDTSPAGRLEERGIRQIWNTPTIRAGETREGVTWEKVLSHRWDTTWEMHYTSSADEERRTTEHTVACAAD